MFQLAQSSSGHTIADLLEKSRGALSLDAGKAILRLISRTQCCVIVDRCHKFFKEGLQILPNTWQDELKSLMTFHWKQGPGAHIITASGNSSYQLSETAVRESIPTSGIVTRPSLETDCFYNLLFSDRRDDPAFKDRVMEYTGGVPGQMYDASQREHTDDGLEKYKRFAKSEFQGAHNAFIAKLKNRSQSAGDYYRQTLDCLRAAAGPSSEDARPLLVDNALSFWDPQTQRICFNCPVAADVILQNILRYIEKSGMDGVTETVMQELTIRSHWGTPATRGTAFEHVFFFRSIGASNTPTINLQPIADGIAPLTVQWAFLNVLRSFPFEAIADGQQCVDGTILLPEKFNFKGVDGVFVTPNVNIVCQVTIAQDPWKDHSVDKLESWFGTDGSPNIATKLEKSRGRNCAVHCNFNYGKSQPCYVADGVVPGSTVFLMVSPCPAATVKATFRGDRSKYPFVYYLAKEQLESLPFLQRKCPP
jgi:hypothetical protein